ncbi:hypothetical protein B0T14DRAFT_154645 [Immersiella caudata]|uniref:Uncharacterized protein n=1 Tax=Immersiella caudata TaxID=314043 RepID=A0AA40C3C7_9PEZI|nr:hypothetical protein B0T14DRAFT_154645 [Immersiella caudata]
MEQSSSTRCWLARCPPQRCVPDKHDKLIIPAGPGGWCGLPLHKGTALADAHDSMLSRPRSVRCHSDERCVLWTCRLSVEAEWETAAIPTRNFPAAEPVWGGASCHICAAFFLFLLRKATRTPEPACEFNSPDEPTVALDSARHRPRGQIALVCCWTSRSEPFHSGVLQLAFSCPPIGCPNTPTCSCLLRRGRGPNTVAAPGHHLITLYLPSPAQKLLALRTVRTSHTAIAMTSRFPPSRALR